MVERLGVVLFWFGSIAGACLVGMGIVVASTMARSTNPDDVTIAPFVFAGFALAALISWLIGRTFRYIFAGRF